MAENSFDDLQLLSQEDLLVGVFRQFLRTYAEFSRREETTRVFLKELCSFSMETRVWFTLWDSGGAQRFTDILRIVGCSRASLSAHLQGLLKLGLIRMVENRYQAVSPAWLVQFSKLKRGKL